MLNIKDAITELQEKSLDSIQRETAYKWASRAMAALELAHTNEQYLLDYSEYQHEALEHAALVEDEAFFLEIKRIFKEPT